MSETMATRRTAPSEMTDSPEPNPRNTDDVLFRAVLEPNRSGHGIAGRLLGLFICCVLVPTGIAFLVVGAWPIVGIMGLEVVGLLFAVHINRRRSRGFETVAVTPEVLTVERYDHAGRRQSWTFQPHWLQVLMDDPPKRDSYLRLRSHGKVLEIGRFLTPEERLTLAKALREAIREMGAICRPEPV